MRLYMPRLTVAPTEHYHPADERRPGDRAASVAEQTHGRFQRHSRSYRRRYPRLHSIRRCTGGCGMHEGDREGVLVCLRYFGNVLLLTEGGKLSPTSCCP